MRDLLHPRAEARAALGAELASLFQSHGYDLVVTPPFEHAEVLERGLAQLDRRDLLRFVEPESGEVALLRPDITPQIARVVATRLSHLPPPFRLRYRGTVIRRRRGRARKHRQIVQVGVEHIGEASAVADVEIATLACRAAEVAGLSSYRLELRLVGLGGTLLCRLPEEARDDAEQALAAKEVAELRRILARIELDDETRSALESLPRLFGGREVIGDARRRLPAAVLAGDLDALSVLAAGLDESGVGDRVIVDLGETRGMAYYTGPSFVLLAEGPGEPVGGGGRYDELLGRFGAPLPATGFAMDLGNLEWAVDGQGRPRKRGARIVCCGSDGRALVTALRDAGAQVAHLVDKNQAEALAFARAWGYDAALAVGATHRATRISDGSERELSDDDAEALLSWAAPAERG
jgi:ATP phosphoribosyltransferase regulatory subunit